MIFAFWAGTGWSSQVNAAIFGVVGVVVIALTTARGVRWQTTKQLDHDTKQRHLDRVNDRASLLVEPRMTAARSFTAAAKAIFDQLMDVATGAPPVRRHGPEEIAWLGQYDELCVELSAAFEHVYAEFGAEAGLDDSASLVLVGMRSVEPSW